MIMSESVLDVLIFKTPEDPESLTEKNYVLQPILKRININDFSESPSIEGVRFPTVAALRKKDVEFKRAFFEVFIQHEKMDLGRYLPAKKNYSKIFILSTKYQSPGSLKNAIKKFLKRANEKEDIGTHLVCIDDHLFEKLSSQLDIASNSIRIPESGKTNLIVDSMDLSDEDQKARDLLELLKDEEGGIKNSYTLEDRYRGTSYSCQLVRHQILVAAGNDLSVCILGERGTGKELVAKAIHDFSEKKKGPFVAINIGAISPDIFEAELFGQKPNYPNQGDPGRLGFWEAANNGTLFLDEIGDMEPRHQPKVLRALVEGEIYRVGESKPIKVNARVIAATNQDIRSKDKNGRYLFRQDLYGRLSKMIIRTPCLDTHRQDIPDLAISFWKKINNQSDLPKDVIDLLKVQRFDNNVRELENILLNLNEFFPTKPTSEKLRCLLKFREDVPTEMISKERIESPDLMDLIEILAKISHETWRAKRTEEGWVWGPKRVETKKLKTNPDLDDFENLSDDQKSYSIEEAKAILRGLLNRGYMIR